MKSQRPVVAFLYLPRLDFGGVESYLLALLRYGKDLYDFRIFSGASDRFRLKAEKLGAMIIDWCRPGRISPLLSAYHLGSQLRSHQVNLLHIQSPAALLPGCIAGSRGRIPVIATIHMPRSGTPGRVVSYPPAVKTLCLTYLDNQLMRYCSRGAIYVSALDYEKAEMGDHHSRRKLIHIPNGVDVEKYHNLTMRKAARSELGVNPNTCAALFFGRFEDQKGLDILLEALHGMQSNLNVWMVGEGRQLLKLQRLAARHGLEGRVRFWGYQDDLRPWLAAADLFVMPSRHEGMPFAILEAMAAGLPCVVSGVGENQRLIENGINGYVVPPEDAEALREALLRLAKSPSHRHELGLKAAESLQISSAEQMAFRTFAFYGDCAASLKL